MFVTIGMNFDWFYLWGVLVIFGASWVIVMPWAPKIGLGKDYKQPSPAYYDFNILKHHKVP